MSEMEKTDAVTSLLAWAQEKYGRPKKTPLGVKKVKRLSDETPIKLWEFRLWFLSCVRTVIKTREMHEHGFVTDTPLSAPTNNMDDDDDADEFVVKQTLDSDSGSLNQYRV